MKRTVQEIIAGVVPGNALDDQRVRDRAYEIIQELWGEGWTFTRRSQDPFDVTGVKPPPGMAYQWVPIKRELDEMKTEEYTATWHPVPYERHDGCFAPIGTKGDIEVSGLALCERRKDYVQAEHQKRIDGAQKNVDDWAKRIGDMFSGHVRVGDDVRPVGKQEPVNATKLAADMWPHAEAIFAERDRLVKEWWVTHTAHTIDDPKQPPMAELTVRAIGNVRAGLIRDAQELLGD